MNVFSKGLVLGVIVLFVGNGIFASVMSKETPIFTILNTGDIIIVDDEGDGDFTFIQNAIDNATCGDIITVYSGMYNETVVIDKQLVLEGIDEEYENGGDTGNPVIDAQNAGTVVEIQANGVRITGFTIQDSKNGSAGIFIARCNDSTVGTNLIISNDYGIHMICSSYNVINENKIKDNKYGIYLENSSNDNTLHKNLIENNKNFGLWITDSFRNFIYHNLFIVNTHNAYDNGSNRWNDTYLDDTGKISGGNYWSDYTGQDNDHDGIGDTPYSIPGDNNKDRYPLMWTDPDIFPPGIDILKPESKMLYIKDNIIMPFPLTLIVFEIEVKVEVYDNITAFNSGIAQVELYIDEELKANWTCPPHTFDSVFIWRWEREPCFLKRHNITVIAYDNAGNQNSKEIKVWKMF